MRLNSLFLLIKTVKINYSFGFVRTCIHLKNTIDLKKIYVWCVYERHFSSLTDYKLWNTFRMVLDEDKMLQFCHFWIFVIDVKTLKTLVNRDFVLTIDVTMSIPVEVRLEPHSVRKTTFALRATNTIFCNSVLKKNKVLQRKICYFECIYYFKWPLRC